MTTQLDVEMQESARSQLNAQLGSNSVAAPSSHQDIDESSTNSEEEGLGVLSGSGQFSVESSDQHTSTRMGIKQRAAIHERRTLAKKETRIIWMLRLFVAVALIFFALSASLSVYYVVSDQENDDFREQFSFHAARVIEAFNIAIQAKFAAVDSLSVTYTSHALSTGSTFPNVTLPYFEYSGAATRIAGDAIVVYFAPLVMPEQTDEWLSYINTQENEILRSIRNEQAEKEVQDELYGHQQIPIGYAEDSSEDHLIPPEIWNLSDEYNKTKSDGYFFPVWQATPLLPENAQSIGLDLAHSSFAEDSLGVVRNYSHASFDIMTNLEDVDGNDMSAAEMYNLYLQFGQYRHSAESYKSDPMTSLSFPVFDTFGPDRKVTGALFTTMYWRLLLRNIFSDNVKGLLCVLSNTQGQFASYQIDGSDATFLGLDDFHSAEYEEMYEEIDVAQYMRNNASAETRTFTSVDLSTAFINYKIRVYPTDGFKDVYVTNAAQVEAISIGSTFIVAMIIFIIYDCCVERRQRIVLDRAVKSTALVSTLFPENVRERVINDGDKRKGRGKGLVGAAPQSNRVAFKASNVSANQMIGGPPIAEKFPETTVFFADLAGFTKWSSSREPEQVFQLLETMFKAFDSIALKCGVFKVEVSPVHVISGWQPFCICDSSLLLDMTNSFSISRESIISISLVRVRCEW